jgi:hypothetical protein
LLLLQPTLFNDFINKQGKKLRNSGFLARLLLIDLEQIPELCDIPDACSWSDEPGLDGFLSILVKHLQDGIERREKMKNVSVLLYLKRRKRYGIHTTNESENSCNQERSCITMMMLVPELWSKLRELQQ